MVMFAINIQNLEKLKDILLKTLILLFKASVVMNMKKIFKEREPIGILKSPGLISNIEEYHKIKSCLKET